MRGMPCAEGGLVIIETQNVEIEEEYCRRTLPKQGSYVFSLYSARALDGRCDDERVFDLFSQQE